MIAAIGVLGVLAVVLLVALAGVLVLAFVRMGDD